MKCVWLLLICVGIVLCIEHDFKGFDDSILFGINWPGSKEALDNIIEGDVSESSDTQPELKPESSVRNTLQ